jgi:hypothetical protein
LTECVVFFDNDDFVTSECKGTGTGQTHHSGTDGLGLWGR